MLAAKGSKEIGDRFNKIIAKLAEANGLRNVIDLADFNDEEKLGKGKEMQDRLTKLVTIFSDLDFRGSRAEGDDLLGDAYEYLMRHFATESGKSKGQFYTPAEVSRILAKVVGIGSQTPATCGASSVRRAGPKPSRGSPLTRSARRPRPSSTRPHCQHGWSQISSPTATLDDPRRLHGPARGGLPGGARPGRCVKGRAPRERKAWQKHD